jgi:transcriptional pleiotropic regulator of transition state genes
MKATGIVRNIDELGRIVVPKEIRNRLGIAKNDPVDIYVDGDSIILKKYAPLCHFCGSGEDVIEFKDKTVCLACVGELSSKV